MRWRLGHLHMVFPCSCLASSSVVVGFQASQENYAEAVFSFKTYPWMPHNIIVAVAMGLPRFKGKECIPCLSKVTLLSRLCGISYMGEAIFGKYNLLQVSFYFRSIALLSRRLFPIFVYSRCSINV